MANKEYIERNKIVSIIEKRQEKLKKRCDTKKPLELLVLGGGIKELEHLKLVFECGDEDNA